MSAPEKEQDGLAGGGPGLVWSPRAERRDYGLVMLTGLALIALWRLAAARIALGSITPAAVLARNAAAARLASGAAPANAPSACDNAAFFIPRVARRVPWRADCLVQALAGQAWLTAAGVASQIRVGADAPASGGIEAHAWLIVGDRVLLGGDITRFSPLISTDIGPRSAAENEAGRS